MGFSRSMARVGGSFPLPGADLPFDRSDPPEQEHGFVFSGDYVPHRRSHHDLLGHRSAPPVALGERQTRPSRRLHGSIGGAAPLILPFRKTTRKILLLVIVDLALTHAVLLGLTWAGLLAGTPVEGIGMTLLAVPYVLHHLGLSVLARSGLSGGGLPSPNILGWLSAFGFWIVLYGGLIFLVLRGKPMDEEGFPPPAQ
jgi:hypothetical protein